MTGNSALAQLITIGVDIGSNIQLFFREQPINLLTALSVKGMKLTSVLVGDVFTVKMGIMRAISKSVQFGMDGVNLSNKEATHFIG